MGFGGFFMHSRTGLETGIPGEDWFRLINRCADYGNKRPETWLYDEDPLALGKRGRHGDQGAAIPGHVPGNESVFPRTGRIPLRTADTAAVFACRIKDGIFPPNAAFLRGVLQEGETAVEFRTRYSALQ